VTVLAATLFPTRAESIVAIAKHQYRDLRWKRNVTDAQLAVIAAVLDADRVERPCAVCQVPFDVDVLQTVGDDEFCPLHCPGPPVEGAA
jgi:hypothetical protein